MRLKKIKLAGFKSFVDPTIIHLNSNLTAIVGPNGCGKSNVIDAVRWVMGESSAKQLRGESMADVIFNGTTARKPVGQAAIELTFDNCDTRLTGEYAKYSELAIRREVNREGFSNYYLNGGRCRRKDIVDVFLGTGLGPHSYSVIEQGMISQLIEAKPEELRGYLEEAAGISKYKERRRETENRIRHTRDNLARLNDIREELARQLRHLKRQANAANRYKTLKQEQRLLKAQLQTLHWQTVNKQMAEQESAILAKQTELEAKRAEQSNIVAELERLRSKQSETTEVYNEVQGRYYKLGAEVGRIEQQIQHNKERCQQLEQDLQQVVQNWQETEQHLRSDKKTIAALEVDLQQLGPQDRVIEKSEQEAKQELLLKEESMKEWQHAWESFNSAAAQNVKQAEVEQTRIEHLEQRISSESQLITKLSEERESLAFTELETVISSVEQECANLKKQSEAIKHKLTTKRVAIATQRDDNNQLLNLLNGKRQELQKLHGQAVSLEALQQAALGKTDSAVNSWLQEHGLAEKPRLAQKIKVTAKEWEKAVETVLSTQLDAVCIDDLAAVSSSVAMLKSSNLLLYATGNSQRQNITKAKTLASKVTTDLPFIAQLNRVYIANDISEALRLSKSLAADESVITPEGIWIGDSWLRVSNARDSKQGILRREQEIEALKNSIATKEQEVAREEQQLQQERAKLGEMEKDLEGLQQEYNKVVALYSDVYGKLTAKQSDLQHLQQRQQTINREIGEHEQKLLVIRQQLQTIQEIWQQAEAQKLTHGKRREILLQQQEQYRSGVELARQKVIEAKEKTSKHAMRAEFIRNKLQYLTTNLERAEGQITNLQQRKELLTKKLTDNKTPITELDRILTAALQRRLAVEGELSAAKRRVDEVEHELRNQESSRTEVEQASQKIHSVLEQLRMEWKALEVRCRTYEEQVAEGNFQLEELVTELPEVAELAEWEEKLAVVVKKIERLGPINLAAINEYEQNSERKQYLDLQNDDLVAALTTLEDAMHKIDRETRTRFKNAFESVNGEFKRLFPIVFGGGKAALEMTTQDLLNSGVQIAAQPPGKRNATIHLLSGGEKALTAIALVFAIFQLNPAPFCMLDEVDAPLDDNNVSRFCNLVTEMANSVQFIFVSHNKITMEIAGQLTGVTMHEPGVSRIVSVNIDEAINLAQKNRVTVNSQGE